MLPPDLHNPWSIKQLAPPDSWGGSHGQDAAGHARFTDPCYSGRAALHILTRNFEGRQTHHPRKLQTFLDLIGDEAHGYAPASDTQGSVPGQPQNNPAEYAEFLSLATSIPSDFELPHPAGQPQIWLIVLHAMAHFETGQAPPWRECFRAFACWYKLDQPVPPAQ